MAFDINELHSSLSRYGYQKASHYTSNVILPPILGGGRIMSETPLRTNSINLPGFNLATDEIRHKGFGSTEKRPISASFEDISITMIADGQGLISQQMLDWMELIYPTNDENIGVDNVEYFEYPVNYYGGLEINLFDITGNLHTTYTFINPFPTIVGGIQLSWETTDSLALVPVTFAYRTYKKNTSHSGFVSSN